MFGHGHVEHRGHLLHFVSVAICTKEMKNIFSEVVQKMPPILLSSDLQAASYMATAATTILLLLLLLMSTRQCYEIDIFVCTGNWIAYLHKEAGRLFPLIFSLCAKLS